jgi:hypothetical protein
MVALAWEESRGAPDPLFLERKAQPTTPIRRRFRSDPVEEIAYELSRVFRVSPQAMKIRLGDLGLLRDHGVGDSMFG